MPIYEYCCLKCNHKFELLCSISQADEDVLCPKCQCHTKRIVSRFASFSKDSSGTSVPVAGTGRSCSSCSASSCNSCH